MRENENVKIIGNVSVLVPYEAKHVPKYHDWMGDEEILRLTASERLSLDEEYAMQKSWREDSDKCTFIILLKELYNESDEVDAMVGDVNLFIDTDEKSAEVEVMIAESSARRRGVGKEAVSLIMSYAINNLGIKSFCVKIGDDNESSLAMFRGLGFEVTSHSDVFQETTLILPDDMMSDFTKKIHEATSNKYYQ